MREYYEIQRDDNDEVYALVKENDACPPHFHNSIELSYVLEGTLNCLVDGRELTVSKGHLLIVSSYMVHQYETPAYCKSILLVIPLGAAPALKHRLSGMAFGRMVHQDARGDIARLIELMVEHRSRPEVQAGISHALLALIIDEVGLTPRHGERQSDLIKRVLDYLEHNYAQDQTLDELAARFGYSASRFSHIFNENLGYTLPGYVSTLRCLNAARMLNETALPVTDIGLQVGFDSPRTFYRAFRRHFALTPSQYRKQMGGNRA